MAEEDRWASVGGGGAMAVVVVELPRIEGEAAKGVVSAAKAALTVRVKRLLHNPRALLLYFVVHRLKDLG
ncbi:hypothetical protein NL676_039850 [Syzygium grande]|nr:hypothetical protein NL676_039850 [Syzygium grande]